MIKVTNVSMSNFTFHSLGFVPDCLVCKSCKRTYRNDEYIDLIENTSFVTCVECNGNEFIVNKE